MYSILVIGNGESRENLNLIQLKQKYSTTIGCNAIHREICVDHLVCCDKRMVDEAIASDNTLQSTIWIRDDWARHFREIKKDPRIFIIPDLPYSGKFKEDQKIHWNSGPSALLVACSLCPDKISLLGFDLYPMDGKINNIYKGTANYKQSDYKPVDYSFWVYQLAKIFKYNPHIEFSVYNKKNWKVPTEWNYPNVNFLEIDLLLTNFLL